MKGFFLVNSSMIKIIFLLFVGLISSGVYADVPVVEYQDCSDEVNVTANDVTLEALLKELAISMKFELTLGLPLTQRVSYQGKYPRDKFIRDILSKQNNYITSDNLSVCDNKLFIIRVSVLEVGKSNGEELVYQYKPEQAPVNEYDYIDDMQQYVLDVLNKKHDAKRVNMSPEQHEEFLQLKKRMKKRKRVLEKMGKSLEEELAKELGVNANE